MLETCQVLAPRPELPRPELRGLQPLPAASRQLVPATVEKETAEHVAWLAVNSIRSSNDQNLVRQRVMIDQMSTYAQIVQTFLDVNQP